MDDDDDNTKPEWWFPAPTEIKVVIDGQPRQLSYEKAFALGCSLLEKGHVVDAAAIFERLEEFPDRGPRAFIMQAFCEAAALHFDKCSQPLTTAFEGEEQALASALHNAFVSYHVGIRQDALKAMAELVNKYREYPTLCLLLGNMLDSADKKPLARKCWSLAVHRDRPGGAVAMVAMRQLRTHSDQPPSAGADS
jgi:hypothetical protein